MGKSKCTLTDALPACAADGVIHTAFRHDGSVPYTDACKIDCMGIKAMTDAMAGSNKPFVMSSGTGVVGETGPQPVTEEFPIDPEHALATRVSTERVGLSSLRPLALQSWMWEYIYSQLASIWCMCRFQ